MEGGEDPHLALLAYITTPLTHNLPSPVELLNSRKFRCLLPVQMKQHKQSRQQRHMMQRVKLQQASHYNKNARNLPKLNIGDTVYVQLKPNKRKWNPGIIVHTGLENSRTYSVQTTQGGQYVRNRKFFRVRHTNNQQHTTRSMKSAPQYYQPTQQNMNTRPTCITRKPQRLNET